MARKTIHCVRLFWRVGNRCEGGPVRQFMRREDAEAYAERRARYGRPVAVFTLEGEPAADHWDEVRDVVVMGADYSRADAAACMS